MKINIFLLTNLISTILAGGLLNGNQEVSYHEYAQLRSVLDALPVFCGIPGSLYNFSMITAVQGLVGSECGTCLKIHPLNKPENYHYVMALDNGGRGLDLNGDTFRWLNNGVKAGLVKAVWKVVNSLHCKDAIFGEFELPGYTDNLNLPYLDTGGAAQAAQTPAPTPIVAQPNQPAVAAQTSTPAAVAQPNQPAAAQPNQPAAAAQPNQPAAVAQPNQPAAVAQPNQPAAIAQTKPPAAAAQPNQPAAVAQSNQPAAVAQPNQNVVVAQSNQPAAVAQPNQNVVVAQSNQPAAAAQPNNPIGHGVNRMLDVFDIA